MENFRITMHTGKNALIYSSCLHNVVSQKAAFYPKKTKLIVHEAVYKDTSHISLQPSDESS